MDGLCSVHSLAGLQAGLAGAMMVFGVLVATLQSSGVRQPYGKFVRKGWGPAVPATWAWIFQESPSALVPVAMLSYCASSTSQLHWQSHLTAAAFITHYIHRAFIFPLRFSDPKPVPALISFLAFCFTCVNGYLQSTVWLGAWHATEPPRTLWPIGMAVWLLGAAINVQADHTLLDLGKTRKTHGYQIPTDGMFKLVSSANYAGEILEWTGYAVACHHLHAYTFAWFTLCNLLPRGLQYHAFYQETFAWRYPANRKAVIPFVL